jgi:hypothetical protein
MPSEPWRYSPYVLRISYDAVIIKNCLEKSTRISDYVIRKEPLYPHRCKRPRGARNSVLLVKYVSGWKGFVTSRVARNIECMRSESPKRRNEIKRFESRDERAKTLVFFLTFLISKQHTPSLLIPGFYPNPNLIRKIWHVRKEVRYTRNSA